jgi:glycerol uptake facilitator protein
MTRQVSRSAPTLGDVVLAEACGTFLLVFFGCGAVHAAVLREAQSGVWQVAVVWGVAIMLAIFAVGAVSGAHINPAITLALAAWGRHPWNRVVPYVLAQTLGAFVAAAVLFLLFAGFLAAKERAKGVVRGEPGSVVTAMCYGEYSPNPAPLAAAPGPFDLAAFEASQRQFGHAAACGAEFLGTLVLGWMVFALTDPRNGGAPPAQLAPVFIGLTVAALISVLAPLTQACFNPARDFGPRLFAWWAGWGRVALPGLDGTSWLTVYILSPAAGAAAGGGLYEVLLRRGLPAAADAT